MTELIKARWLACVLVLAATGCESTFHETGHYTVEPREPDCEVAILTVSPREDYREIGVLEFDSSSPGSLRRLSVFDRRIICRRGGNALLYGTPNSEGEYAMGTVLLVDWAED